MDLQPLKSHSQQIIERRLGEPIESVLRRLYVERGMTQAQVAAALGVSRQTVIKWLGDFAIETRRPEPDPRSEAVA